MENRKGYEPVHILIYIREKGLVLQEISLLTFDKNTNKIIAVGEESKKYQDSNDQNRITTCPLRWGVIADFETSVKMFQYFLKKAMGPKSIFSRKPKIAVCIPKDTTQVENKAFTETFYQIGAKEVFLSEFTIEETLSIIPSDVKIIVAIVPIK